MMAAVGPEAGQAPAALPVSIVQNCYVVRDLEAACARFHRLYGIGPFVGGAEVMLDNHIYRGKPAGPVHLRGVFVQSGDLNIELVEILSAGPSAFHDMFAKGAEGLHHVAMFAQDYEAAKTRFLDQGLAIASEFTVSFGAKICYVDARPALGHMIELYPENDIIRRMYAEAKAAPATWDGSRLIIPWPEWRS